MKTIFIIGGMGSGKSEVANQLEKLGALHIDLDKLGHEALVDPQTQKALVSAFGPDILDETGTVDREKLAKKAFEGHESHQTLTAVMFPRIAEILGHKLGGLRKQLPHALVVVEASSYDGPDGSFSIIPDDIVAVEAPVETRVARAIASGFSEGDVCLRIAQQPTDEERRGWANHIIQNTGTFDDLKKATENIWQELKG